MENVSKYYEFQQHKVAFLTLWLMTSEDFSVFNKTPKSLFSITNDILKYF